jgi:hypothetical protein
MAQPKGKYARKELNSLHIRTDLGQNSDLLLDVLDLVLGFLEIDNLDRNYLLRAVVQPENRKNE